MSLMAALAGRAQNAERQGTLIVLRGMLTERGAEAASLAFRPIRLGPSFADNGRVRKFLQAVLASLGVVIIAGTIASAAGSGSTASAKPTLLVSSAESPEPTETESPDSTDTESDSPDPDTGTSGVEPDFKACAGLRGLDNAICRHRALLSIKPASHGLANSLAHLQANLSKNLARDAARASGVHGNSDSAPGHRSESNKHESGGRSHTGS
jgi:hypothetical protein